MSGEVPEGWCSFPLSKVAKIAMGETLLSKNLTGTGVPVFSANTDSRPWGYTDRNRKTLKRGTIVVGARGSIGFPRLPAFETFTSTQTTIAVEPDASVVDSTYLHAVLCAADIPSLSAQQAVPMLTIGMLAPLPIFLPPLDEQRRIAEVLRSVDEAIGTASDAARHAASTLNRVISSLFEPYATASGGSETETAPLSEFCQRITYGFTNPMPTTDSGPWMVTALNIKNGRIEYGTARHTSASAYDALTDKSRPQIGSVLVTKDGTLGRVAVVDQPDICVNQSVAVLDPRPDCLNAQFLSYLLQSEAGQARMLADSGGGSVKHIYITKLGAMPISVPSYEAQIAIADHAIECSAAVQSADASLRQLHQLRASTTFDLLSGRVRVPA